MAKDDISFLIDSIQRLIETGSTLVALRGIFHGFRQFQDIRSCDMDQMLSRLDILYWFGKRLQSMLCMVRSDFALSRNTQQLLGYRVTEDNLSHEAILLLSSPINRRLSLNAPGGFGSIVRRKTNHGENVISIEQAGCIGREILIQEFRQIIENHCTAAKNARAFQPICTQSIAEKCRQPKCRNLHVFAERMEHVVNQQFSLFLSQMLVINNTDVVMRSAKYELRRYEWSYPKVGPG